MDRQPCVEKERNWAKLIRYRVIRGEKDFAQLEAWYTVALDGSDIPGDYISNSTGILLDDRKMKYASAIVDIARGELYDFSCGYSEGG